MQDLVRLICAAAGLVVAALPVSGQPSSGAAPSLEYDAAAPLDLDVKEISVRDGIRVSTLRFANPRGGRSEGMLVAPVQIEGKTGAIIWMHSGGGTNNLSDAMLMARAGAVSAILEPSGAQSMKAEEWRDEMVRSILGIRRAVDMLAAREDVDPKRIAYVGHSYGAMVGAVAAADRRFRAAVFEVGLLGMSIHIRTSPHPWAAGIRKELGDKLAPFLEVVEPLDATHFVGRLAPTPLLFQSARLDSGVPEKDAMDFFAAASEPKQIRWYDTGHDVLDIQAIADRARFLAEQLALRPIDPILKAKLGIEE